MTIVDSNVLIDVFSRDPSWFRWSTRALARQTELGRIGIVDIIFAEVSISFPHWTDVEQALAALSVERLTMSASALHVAGHAFKQYRSAGGPRTTVLPDFLIGAQAQVAGLPILTRDVRRYASYFPTVELIAPGKDV
jgi:predicted nucleic acid-binding protein